MRKRTVKATALAMLAGGCMFQLSCLGTWFKYIWQAGPAYLLLEYTLDNDGLIDFVGDDGTNAWL